MQDYRILHWLINVADTFNIFLILEQGIPSIHIITDIARFSSLGSGLLSIKLLNSFKCCCSHIFFFNNIQSASIILHNDYNL